MRAIRKGVELKKNNQWVVLVFGIFLLCAGMLFVGNRNVYAGTWDDAYTYYNTYGNQVVFHAASQTDGYLYYATGSKTSTAGTRFRTVGWKVSVRDRSGQTLQTVYFQLGGSYMACVDITYRSGYEYDLYAVSLGTLKQRLNTAAQDALSNGNCTITFDACMTVVQNGKEKGGINDSGVTWGSVYTTYQGIAGAANWSAASRASLASYFDKSANGLFYTVYLGKGTGIVSVSGGGTYCYGTYVTIAAVPQKGYQFSYWSGTGTSYSKDFGFYVQSASAWTAYGVPQETTVTFCRNRTGDDTVTAVQTFTYGNQGQTFCNPGWMREGYHQLGWSRQTYAETASYTMDYRVTDEWIGRYAPGVHLYAVWEENSYALVFDANGAEDGTVPSVERSYTQTFGMPENAYRHTEKKCSFLGWSSEPTAFVPEYAVGEEVSVSALVKKAGVENTNHAVITLYAIWDEAPAIDAEDLYYPLTEAQNGKITEAELASHIRAVDPEDGVIPYGCHESNSFLLTDYAQSDFLSLSDSGSVTQNCTVIDSAGNRTERRITVHVIDTGAVVGSEVFGKTRLIGQKYFEDESQNLIPKEQGGLDATSVWAAEEEYRNVLREALRQTVP